MRSSGFPKSIRRRQRETTEMKNKYQDWIDENILDTADILCLEWSGLMAQVFPELKLAEGSVLADDDRFWHFWCIDPDGEIVDPTACQFDEIIRYRFEKYPTATGICPVCGNNTYLGNTCCSVPCYCSADTE